MSKFGTLAAGGGYDVIDESTGRPIAHRETLHSANGVAWYLNDLSRSKSANALVGGLERLRAQARPPVTPATLLAPSDPPSAKRRS